MIIAVGRQQLLPKTVMLIVPSFDNSQERGFLLVSNKMDKFLHFRLFMNNGENIFWTRSTYTVFVLEDSIPAKTSCVFLAPRKWTLSTHDTLVGL